ncbi:MAG: hypothetical protein QOF97_165 [Acidimicrobiaceae bacterium]|jgi:hypothetical protein
MWVAAVALLATWLAASGFFLATADEVEPRRR